MGIICYSNCRIIGADKIEGLREIKYAVGSMLRFRKAEVLVYEIEKIHLEIVIRTSH